MKVIATKVGFFGSLREVGDKFDVPDGEKASWFEPVASNTGTEKEPSGTTRNRKDQPGSAANTGTEK